MLGNRITALSSTTSSAFLVPLSGAIHIVAWLPESPDQHLGWNARTRGAGMRWAPEKNIKQGERPHARGGDSESRVD